MTSDRQLSSAADAARAARAFRDAPGPHVRAQHTVSRVLLNQFAEPVGGVRQVGVHHVQRGPGKPIGVSRAGRVDNFLTVGSASAEALWASVETKVHDVLTHLRAGASALPGQHAVTVKEVVALHYVRSKATRADLNRVRAAQVPRLRDELLAKYEPGIVAQFTATRGRPPRTRSELVSFMDELSAESRELVASGAWDRARFPGLFKDALRFASTWHVSVRTLDEGELLVADNPVVTWADGSAGAGRVAWGAARAVMMPLAPHLLAVLSRNTNPPPVSVEEVNRAQVQSAHEYVFHRPSHPQTTLIQDALCGR